MSGSKLHYTKEYSNFAMEKGVVPFVLLCSPIATSIATGLISYLERL